MAIHGETSEILHRIEPWAGDPAKALLWFETEPLPEFGGRTAETLVKSGRAAAVLEYLAYIEQGGFT